MVIFFLEIFDFGSDLPFYASIFSLTTPLAFEKWSNEVFNYLKKNIFLIIKFSLWSRRRQGVLYDHMTDKY